MLDKNGFKRKNYAILIAEMEVKAKELFGDDVNLSPWLPLGILIRLFCYFNAKMYEVAEKTYNSSFVVKAEGVQLDYLTPNYNTSRNVAEHAYVTLKFTGTENHVIPEQTGFQTNTGIVFELIEEVTIDSSRIGVGVAICTVAGIEGNVLASTIVNQIELDSGVETVTNEVAATGGTDRESDNALKERLTSTTGGKGTATVDAIQAAVANATRVRGVKVRENKTLEIVNGDLPKSVHVFCLGGDVDSIAQAIHVTLTGGIDTNGPEEVVVKDKSGNDQVIHFTYADEIDIYVKVTVQVNNNFEESDIELIKREIISTIDGSLGSPVIYSKVIHAVHEIDSVEDSTILIGTNLDSLGQSNILFEPNEAPRITLELIEVVVT